jgi:hypothetical protein
MGRQRGCVSVGLSDTHVSGLPTEGASARDPAHRSTDRGHPGGFNLRPRVASDATAAP